MELRQVSGQREPDIAPGRFRSFRLEDLDHFPVANTLPASEWQAMQVVAHVLPFRVNEYVARELIDWSAVPNDPIFQLTFPQRGMLTDEHFARMEQAVQSGADKRTLREVADSIRMELNPHPAGQLVKNVPRLAGERVPGVQRKYRETCLIFPAQGQTCHAYCTFCFRWPQFVGIKELKFATDQAQQFARFIEREKDLTDVLITGGDPMVMKTKVLESYIEPLLGPGFEHIQDIRIGTKSVGYWPYRFVTDPDADDLLRLFERVVASGKHLALMAHYSHPRELSTKVAREAVRRIRATGAQIRTQSPVIGHVNDDPEVWTELWRTQVRMGMVPYYMFVERDTGARHYFEIPLIRAHQIYKQAIERVSGLARTARGPSMSTAPGKICIDGTAQVNGQDVFVLRFLQAIRPEWVHRPFFARFDAEARWLGDLRPAFGEDQFFFERELAREADSNAAAS